MHTICLTRSGYKYFLVPKEDGYYWLYSNEDFALQYMRSNEQCGVIISITKNNDIIVKLADIIVGHTVTEIRKEDGAYKIKLS